MNHIGQVVQCSRHQCSRSPRIGVLVQQCRSARTVSNKHQCFWECADRSSYSASYEQHRKPVIRGKWLLSGVALAALFLWPLNEEELQQQPTVVSPVDETKLQRIKCEIDEDMELGARARAKYVATATYARTVARRVESLRSKLNKIRRSSLETFQELSQMEDKELQEAMWSRVAQLEKETAEVEMELNLFVAIQASVDLECKEAWQQWQRVVRRVDSNIIVLKEAEQQKESWFFMSAR